MDYESFLKCKEPKIKNVGFEPWEINSNLFPFQRDLVNWAVRKGKAALWTGTGTGKTRMQLSWADQVAKHTGGKVLILAPLAVSKQTQDEGLNIGIDVSRQHGGQLVINNYEQIHNINPSDFVGVVLDESSMLKSFSSKYKNMVVEYFHRTPYKLCCSATPSPNDFTEIGNHAEFLNICSRSEMLSTFFVHDSGETQKWRLKGHAEIEFFKWLSTWAIMIINPSDIGYDNGGFDLPPLRMHEHIVESKKTDGFLFTELAKTLNERRQARKESLDARCKLAADISKGSSDSWLYWCDLNYESTTLKNTVDDIVEVTGSDKNEIKEDRLLGFASGKYLKLVSKPKIAAMGLNLQICHNVVFVGLSDSFEAMYQAIRRCWRFGQKYPVDVHIIISEKEGNVLQNIKRKEAKAEKMLEQMVKFMGDLTMEEIKNGSSRCIDYNPIKKMEIVKWM